MAERLVTIVGGSGFIGRYVVERLATVGARVRIAVRHPNDALFLKPMGDVGQIQLVGTNILDATSVRRVVRDSDSVINLVGILHNSRRQTFEALQADGAGLVAEAAAAAGVRQYVHVSALGARHASPSAYARTKARGEDLVRAAFPAACILRPSLVIGSEDGFFNRFAYLAAKLPLLPIPGCNNRFQPVYVGDVAEAVTRAATGAPGTAGGLYELGGPQVMDLRALLELMMAYTGVHRPIINLPWSLAMVQATLLGLLPTPPLTRDQVHLLRQDNIVSEGARTLQNLGIQPTAIAAVLPRYITQYKIKGQFSGM